MGLAQAGLAVDEQGIVAQAGVFRHLPGGGVGKFVGGAHHKPVKDVLLGAREEGGGLCFFLLEAVQLFLGRLANIANNRRKIFTVWVYPAAALLDIGYLECILIFQNGCNRLLRHIRRHSSSHIALITIGRHSKSDICNL